MTYINNARELEDARTAEAVRAQSPYRVRYYDRKLSHKGQGVQVRAFTNRTEAEAFAASNQLYARPCVVEVA